MTTLSPKSKAPKTETAAPETPAPTVVAGFSLDMGFELPPRTKFGGGKSSDYPFNEMPVNASFLIPVKVPDNITDDAERAKAFSEEARKVSNRVSGAIRRHRKAHPDQDFAIRTVNNDRLGHGVRVWRIEATQDAAA